MSVPSPFHVLQSSRSSLVVDCRGAVPAVLYWGAALDAVTSPEMLALLATRQETQANVAVEAPVALSPEFGAGFTGEAGIQVQRAGSEFGTYTELHDVESLGANGLKFVSSCARTKIEVTHRLELHPTSDVLVASTDLRNVGDTPLSVERCYAPCLPLPGHCDTVTGFEGRWANEFQQHSLRRFAGTYLRENRKGRTSHDCWPSVIVHEQSATERGGDVYGMHLGWSGNHRIRVEELADGRVYALLGELFHPGELRLAAGESYRSPALFAACSQNGFGGMSRSFHRYVRQELTDERVARDAKPVHFNTWEAVYFDTTEPKLSQLVDAASDVGVERFVLDDGWFRNRNSDTAGLGDWYVDDAVFPNGLGPLIAKVHDRGMQFGLWIEPEMANPDSDLLRAHPDWVLGLPPAPAVMTRNQCVLDLTRSDVVGYLYERLDALLSEYPIQYLKWDMNRDLNQPGDEAGRAAGHRQTLALYELMRRVREAHPTVEIESCASGGGRVDFGVLRFTDRFWTSDSNDPLDRLRIQQGFSLFLPPEVMGSHVGPRDCHITGRTTDMSLRAGVAMFGDFGIEADLLELSADEREELKAAVALHKRFRGLLFSGDGYRLATRSHEIAHGVVSADQTEALFSFATLDSEPRSTPGKLRLNGLRADQRYSVNIVWPQQPESYSTSILDVIDGAVVSGAALMQAGIQLPVLKPQSILVLHLQAD